MDMAKPRGIYKRFFTLCKRSEDCWQQGHDFFYSREPYCENWLMPVLFWVLGGYKLVLSTWILVVSFRDHHSLGPHFTRVLGYLYTLTTLIKASTAPAAHCCNAIRVLHYYWVNSLLWFLSPSSIQHCSSSSSHPLTSNCAWLSSSDSNITQALNPFISFTKKCVFILSGAQWLMSCIYWVPAHCLITNSVFIYIPPPQHAVSQKTWSWQSYL